MGMDSIPAIPAHMAGRERPCTSTRGVVGAIGGWVGKPLPLLSLPLVLEQMSVKVTASPGGGVVRGQRLRVTVPSRMPGCGDVCARGMAVEVRLRLLPVVVRSNLLLLMMMARVLGMDTGTTPAPMPSLAIPACAPAL